MNDFLTLKQPRFLDLANSLVASQQVTSGTILQPIPDINTKFIFFYGNLHGANLQQVFIKNSCSFFVTFAPEFAVCKCTEKEMRENCRIP